MEHDYRSQTVTQVPGLDTRCLGAWDAEWFRPRVNGPAPGAAYAIVATVPVKTLSDTVPGMGLLFRRISDEHTSEVTSVGDSVQMGSGGGVVVTCDGVVVGTSPALADAIEAHCFLTACKPDDEFLVDDEQVLFESLTVDLGNSEFPGERFQITVNGEPIDVALEDCGLLGEYIASVDSVCSGDLGQVLYRFGPWLERWYSGDPEQRQGWRIEGEFDAHGEALDFTCAGLESEYDGPWDNLEVDSPYLGEADKALLGESLAPLIGHGGTLRLNGEELDISRPSLKAPSPQG